LDVDSQIEILEVPEKIILEGPRRRYYYDDDPTTSDDE
jgi:hypothetical protein